jgi:hypothetical protein
MLVGRQLFSLNEHACLGLILLFSLYTSSECLKSISASHISWQSMGLADYSGAGSKSSATQLSIDDYKKSALCRAVPIIKQFASLLCSFKAVFLSCFPHQVMPTLNAAAPSVGRQVAVTKGLACFCKHK